MASQLSKIQWTMSNFSANIIKSSWYSNNLGHLRTLKAALIQRNTKQIILQRSESADSLACATKFLQQQACKLQHFNSKHMVQPTNYFGRNSPVWKLFGVSTLRKRNNWKQNSLSCAAKCNNRLNMPAYLAGMRSKPGLNRARLFSRKLDEAQMNSKFAKAYLLYEDLKSGPKPDTERARSSKWLKPQRSQRFKPVPALLNEPQLFRPK